MGKTWTKIQGIIICLLMASTASAFVVEFDDDVKLTADESLLWFYNGIYYINFGASSSLAGNYSFLWPINDGDNNQYLMTDGSGVLSFSSSFNVLMLLERSSNPDEPSDGEAVIWLSDGTGFGDAGDVMIASATGGVARYGTLFDFSGGTLYQAAPENVIYAGEDVIYAGEQVVYP